MQADHAESTSFPDECCSMSSLLSSELTSGDGVQSLLDITVLQAALADCDMAAHVIDLSQPDFPIIAVSEGLSMLTEYSRHELPGNSCRLLSFKCNNDPVNVALLKDARSKEASFETVLVNRKKSGQLYHVLVVLRCIAAGNKTIGQDRRFLLGLQIELPHHGEDEDVSSFGHVAPELIALTKDTADKLALHLSQQLEKQQDSSQLNDADSCSKQCSILQVELFWVGMGLAPLIISVLCSMQHYLEMSRFDEMVSFSRT